jgi:hypothetical protein
MIAQIKKGKQIVAEILVAGPRVSTKIVSNVPRLESHIRYLLGSKFIVGDPVGVCDIISAKIGEAGDPASFIMLKQYGETTEFSIEILNPPKFETPEPEEGLVF